MEGEAHGMNPVGGQSQIMHMQRTLCRTNHGTDHVEVWSGHKWGDVQDVQYHKSGEVSKKTEKVAHCLKVLLYEQE